MSVVRVLEDGTRVYSNGAKYKPMAPEERKRTVRKPDSERAVRWQSIWYVLYELVPDTARTMPSTIEDEKKKPNLKGRSRSAVIRPRS